MVMLSAAPTADCTGDNGQLHTANTMRRREGREARRSTRRFGPSLPCPAEHLVSPPRAGTGACALRRYCRTMPCPISGSQNQALRPWRRRSCIKAVGLCVCIRLQSVRVPPPALAVLPESLLSQDIASLPWLLTSSTLARSTSAGIRLLLRARRSLRSLGAPLSLLFTLLPSSRVLGYCKNQTVIDTSPIEPSGAEPRLSSLHSSTVPIPGLILATHTVCVLYVHRSLETCKPNFTSIVATYCVTG